MHSKHEVDRQRRRRRVGNKGGMPGARRRELVVGQEACGGGGDDEEHEEEERPTSGAEERGHADEADAASCARADLAVSSELSSKFLRLLNVPMIRSGSVGISDPQWLFFFAALRRSAVAAAAATNSSNSSEHGDMCETSYYGYGPSTLTLRYHARLVL